MIFLIVYSRIRHARRWRSGASLRPHQVKIKTAQNLGGLRF